MQISEQEIVQGCKTGDRRMQHKLYSTYAGKMLVLCHRYSRTTAEAEDILQDAFVKIFAKIDSFRFESSLGAWIRSIVVNTAINQIRKDKDLAYSVEIDNASNIASSQVNVLDGLQLNDLIAMIRTLPKGCQTVFNMFAIDGYGHDEIAEKLGISAGTSKSQYARAKGILQKKLVNNNPIGIDT